MINYPDINPVAISIPFSGFWGNSIDIHWYALAYVVGAYLIYFHMLSTREKFGINLDNEKVSDCLLYTSPSPRDLSTSRMPSSA